MTAAGRRRPRRSPPRSREVDSTSASENETDSIPHFDLVLDRSPSERWNVIAAEYRARFMAVVQENQELLAMLEATLVAPTALLLRLLPAEQREEVRALSRLLGWPVSLLARINLVYELAVFSSEGIGGACGCTAICYDHPDGGALHARSLDWAWLEGLDTLLVDLSVWRSGTLLYRCTSFVGYVGVLTGMRMGGSGHASDAAGWSVSVNYRRPYRAEWTADGQPTLSIPPWYRNRALASALRHALLGGWLVASLLRQLLEEPGPTSFAHVLSRLRRTRLVAPSYVMLVGAARGEACEVACGDGWQRRELHLPALGVICTTNVDSFGDELPCACVDPVAAGGSDALTTDAHVHATAGDAEAKDYVQGESHLRRDLACKLANGLGGWAQRDECLQVMQAIIETPPLANEATVHTTIMCAATGTFNSRRSLGPALFEACAYDPELGVCGVCTACNEPTAAAAILRFVHRRRGPHRGRSRHASTSAASEEDMCEDALLRAWRPDIYKAAHLQPGSLLRRRGGGYYCFACLPLEHTDLCKRELAPS